MKNIFTLYLSIYIIKCIVKMEESANVVNKLIT